MSSVLELALSTSDTTGRHSPGSSLINSLASTVIALGEVRPALSRDVRVIVQIQAIDATGHHSEYAPGALELRYG